MKGVRLIAVLFLASMLTLSIGCGGGGGDGGGGGGGGLATGTFIKAPSNNSTIGGGFLNSGNAYNRVQNLYLASDIDASGKITALTIKYRNDLVTAQTCTGVTFKLGHTNLVNLGATFANNQSTGQGGQTTVLSNGIVSFPTGSAGTLLKIPFTATFDYNGVDNLVLDMERIGTCSDTTNWYEAYEDRAYNGVVYSSAPASATGTPAPFTMNAKLTFSGGDNALDYGGANSNTFPFHTAGRHVQLLYPASEVNGSGPITGIGMQVSAVTSEANYTYTVKLGHTTLSDLTADFAANFDSGSPTTVVSAGSVTIPAGVPVDDYVWIPITGSFNYNGTDNLIVDIEVQAGAAASTSWRNLAGSGGRRLYATVGAATGVVDSFTYHTTFRFNGGTMDVITPGSVTWNIPFAMLSNQHKIQWLYESTSLGTGGKITKVAFRLKNDSLAYDFADVNIVMGETSLSALGTTSFAGNITTNRTTVFSGTVSIPAGLKAGDWISVPLSAPITYSGTKNLIVQTDALVPAVKNQVVGVLDASRYPSHLVGNLTDRTSDVPDPAITMDAIADIRFTLSK